MLAFGKTAIKASLLFALFLSVSLFLKIHSSPVLPTDYQLPASSDALTSALPSLTLTLPFFTETIYSLNSYYQDAVPRTFHTNDEE